MKMPDAELMEVRLIDLPVQIWARAQEHGDELIREFALIATQLNDVESDAPNVPQRLTELIGALVGEYGTLTSSQEEQLATAAESGQRLLPELVFHLPPSAAPAAAELGRVLEEADAYCAAGESLLTLATPPDLVAFRRWYLDEFTRQTTGLAPTPWPDYARSAGHPTS